MLECMRSAVNVMAPLITVLTAADTGSRRVHPACTVYVLRRQKFKRCPGKSWKNSTINSRPFVATLFYTNVVRSERKRKADIVKRELVILLLTA